MGGRQVVPVTLADVAQVCGVSVSTVSKALAGSHEISDGTTKRVREVSRGLGYRPRRGSRLRRRGSLRTVGLLTDDASGRASLLVHAGAFGALEPEQLGVLLCDSGGDLGRRRRNAHTLVEHGVDGLIVVSSRAGTQPSLGALPVPVVYAVGRSSAAGDFSLVCDDYGGARLAVSHLMGQGGRRIVHITGPPRDPAARRRAQAWRDVLREAGVRPSGEPLWGDWTRAWGYEAARLLIEDGVEFDAVFCGSDSLALGVYDCLLRLAKKDVRHTGAADLGAPREIGLGSRPLATVDLRLQDLGREAVRALFDAFSGHGRHGTQLMPTTFLADVAGIDCF